MAQKILNEEQMREYVEQEVRAALIQEGLDESLNENLEEGLIGRIGEWLKGRLEKKVGGSRIGSFIQDHANTEDLINLAIGVFGVGTLAKWLCQALGIDMSSPLANILVRAISGYATMKVGDSIQARRAAEATDNGQG